VRAKSSDNFGEYSDMIYATTGLNCKSCNSDTAIHPSFSNFCVYLRV